MMLISYCHISYAKIHPFLLRFGGGVQNEYRKYIFISKRQILMRSDTKLPQPFASWSNSL